MKRPHGAEIQIEVDEETGYRYIIWQPMVTVGLGDSAGAALEDLRCAAHAGIDCGVDGKLRELAEEGGSDVLW